MWQKFPYAWYSGALTIAIGLFIRRGRSGRHILRQQHALLDAAIHVVGNRYHTTMLIAKRIRQLHHGARPQVPHEDAESFFTIAVREIAAGHLAFDPGPPSQEDPPVTTAISGNGALDGDREGVETVETSETADDGA